MAGKKTGTKFFYGYIVIFASLLILVLMHGIHAAYGVFLTPIQAEFGWNRATLSGAHSLAFLLTGLFATAAGRLTDRYGPRRIIVLGSLILGIGYFLTSRVSTLWQLYLFYGVIVGMGTSSGDVALLSTAARWFVKRRGLMTSVVKVGTGVGMFVMPLAASGLIVSYGWRTAYIVLAIVAVVGIIAFAQLLRRDPAQLRLQPYGMTAENTGSQVVNGADLTLRQAFHTRQLWLVCAAYFLVWYATQSVMIHIAAYSVDTGLSVARAASVISVIGGVSILGRLTMGGVGDRIGNRRALIACFAVLVVALILLQFAGGLWLLYLFAAIYGFAHGGFFAVLSPLVAELFGLSAHATNLGVVLFLGMLGGATGPVVTGYIFDSTHTYRLAFFLLVFAAAGGLVLSTLLKPVGPSKPETRTVTSPR